MLDVKEALTHKIGPLPGGVWAGIAVIGIVVVVKMRKKGSTSSSTASTTDPGTSALDTTGGLLGGGGGAGGGVLGGGTDTGSTSSTGTFVDPTPTFVPIPDPGATVMPEAPTPASGSSSVNTAPPADVILPVASPTTQVLNVSSRGALLGTVQAPILPIGTPASELYKAVGLKASDPFTLTPPAEPQNATQTIEVAQAQAERQAQATAHATHQAVAV